MSEQTDAGRSGGSPPNPGDLTHCGQRQVASGRCRAGDSRPLRPLHLPSASTRRGDDSARGLLPSIALSSGRVLSAYLAEACCARIFARSPRASSSFRSRSPWIAFCLSWGTQVPSRGICTPSPSISPPRPLCIVWMDTESLVARLLDRFGS
jgi:hypothetical protein